MFANMIRKKTEFVTPLVEFKFKRWLYYSTFLKFHDFYCHVPTRKKIIDPLAHRTFIFKSNKCMLKKFSQGPHINGFYGTFYLCNVFNFEQICMFFLWLVKERQTKNVMCACGIFVCIPVWISIKILCTWPSVLRLMLMLFRLSQSLCSVGREIETSSQESYLSGTLVSTLYFTRMHGSTQKLSCILWDYKRWGLAQDIHFICALSFKGTKKRAHKFLNQFLIDFEFWIA